MSKQAEYQITDSLDMDNIFSAIRKLLKTDYSVIFMWI